MKPLVILDVPGLSQSLLKRAPKLRAWAQANHSGLLTPEQPALTIPGHASLLTGQGVDEHGVVANGWFHRDLNQVIMWPQGEGLVQGEAIWDTAKTLKPDYSCFKYFWWPGMGSTADIYGNVRPVYYADGRKSGGLYMNTPGLADQIQANFGQFPLFDFWGPATSIASSQWILDSASYVMKKHPTDLSLIYVPHLDYKQQSHGPRDPVINHDITAVDNALSNFIERHQGSHHIILLSSYAITDVDTPVYLNRVLREAGHLHVIHNDAGELIDTGASRAFAVCDHQIAHVYVRQPNAAPDIKAALSTVAGVGSVLDDAEQKDLNLYHPRNGELLLLAEPKAWFAYYYWLDDIKAPDFARTVAIHAKPGYDPCEMHIDPAIASPKWHVASRVLKKKLGMRYLMDVTPLDATLIKGSHGLLPANADASPVCISSFKHDHGDTIAMTAIKSLVLDYIKQS